MTKLNLWQKMPQIVQFGFAGLVNSSVFFLIYLLLLSFNVNYLFSSVIAYFFGISVAYLINVKYVFRHKKTSRNVILFFAIYFSSLLLNLLLLYAFVHFLGFDKVLAQLLAMFVNLFYNFYLNKFWTFKTPKKTIKTTDEDFNDNQFISEISFFCSVLAYSIGIIYWFARLGFNNNSLIQILSVVGVSLLLISLPDILVILESKLRRQNNWYNSWPAIIFYTLIVIFFCGILAIFINLLPLLSGLGFALSLILLYYYFRNVSLKRIASVFLLALFFSAWVIGAIWGTEYLNPLFMEKIALGNVHIDTLFHSDVSNMILTYATPSTGLSGIPYLHYHWGSHAIFAEVARLFKINMVVFYNLAYPVIFIPFLVKTFISLIYEIRKYFKYPLKLNLLSWLLIIFGFSGILPIILLKQFSIITSVMLISGSYLLSLSLCWVLLGVSINYFKSNQLFSKQKSANNYVFLLIFLPLLLGLIGLNKISILFLLLVLGFYLFIRFKLYASYLYVFSLLISTLITVLIYKFVNLSGQSPFLAFAYIRQYVSPEYWTFYLIVYYFWAGLYFILRLYKSNIRYLAELKTNFKSHRILDLEILAVFSLAGFLPGAMLAIGGGSAGYFSDPQRWLAIILIVSSVSFYTSNKNAKKNIQNKKLLFAEVKLTLIMAILVIIPFAVSSVGNIISLNRSFIVDNIETRISLLPAGYPMKTIGHVGYIKKIMQDEQLTFFQSVLKSASEPQRKLDTTHERGYVMVNYLASLSTTPENQKRKTLVFIPQSNKLYWNLIQYKKIQFLSPALTGMASLHGIQPFIPEEMTANTMELNLQKLNQQDKDVVLSSYIKTEVSKAENKTNTIEYILKNNLSQSEKIAIYDILSNNNFRSLKDYGFESYQIIENEQNYLMQTSSDQSLCLEATAKGFNRIIVVTTDENNLPQQRIIICQ